jgi:hypothetical protein
MQEIDNTNGYLDSKLVLITLLNREVVFLTVFVFVYMELKIFYFLTPYVCISFIISKASWWGIWRRYHGLFFQ